MRVLDFLAFGSRKTPAEKPHGDALPLAADDAATTRRALLTGGAAVAAAAATVASSDRAAAAPAYVVLGAANTATKATIITDTTGAVGIVGIAKKANATGIVGNADAGASAIGVKGTSKNGTGVQGTSTDGVAVVGTSTNDEGVNGSGAYVGVRGNGGSYGGVFYGTNSGSYGVYASGPYIGVYGNGPTYGIRGVSAGGYGVSGTGAIGVYGNGSTYGVSGSAPATGANHGVHGSGGQFAVFGTGGYTGGVRGESNYVGVWAEGRVYGLNVLATATSGQSFGIYSHAASAGDAFAMYANGKVHVNGTLSKSAGSFKIDHPLDPERKWLQHSFVESPDMMNVYNGNVTTDANGLAVVKLPAYFDALNRDFRYQLTVIGKMAQAIVDREIADNQFRIRTNQGNVKVSWQVTGVRQDDYAKAHPIVVETVKRKEDVGTREFLPHGTIGRSMNLGPK